MKNAIRYVVTVKAVVERVETAGKEWRPVSDAPGAEYAYTPEISKTVQREIQIFEQHLEELDIRKLAAVLNGISGPI